MRQYLPAQESAHKPAEMDLDGKSENIKSRPRCARPRDGKRRRTFLPASKSSYSRSMILLSRAGQRKDFFKASCQKARRTPLKRRSCAE